MRFAAQSSKMKTNSIDPASELTKTVNKRKLILRKLPKILILLLFIDFLFMLQQSRITPRH